MNSQVLIDRVFLQDLLFLIKQPRTKIDARAVLVFGIELALNAAPVQQVSVPNERANFESEYLKANYPRVYSGELSAPPIFGQAGKGEYEDDDMQKCWVMWQSRAELAEWSPVMQNLGDDNQQLRAKLDASKFCADVADDLRAELAAAKETITRYETTAENCEVLRAELAAIKAQEPVTEVSEETFSSDGTSDVITHNLPIGTKLYAAPVAKQVVMTEALDRAFITGESCDGVYRVVIQSETLKEMQSVHNWIVRLNAADHSEDVRAMVVPDVDALKAEIASLSVRLENSDAVISSIQKIITRLASSQPTGKGGE